MFSGRKSSAADLAKRGLQPFNAAPATRDSRDTHNDGDFVSLNQCKRDRRTIEEIQFDMDKRKSPADTHGRQPASQNPISKRSRPQICTTGPPITQEVKRMASHSIIPEELKGPMPKNEADFLKMLARAHPSFPDPCCQPKIVTSEAGVTLEYRRMYRTVLVKHGGFGPVCASNAWDQIAEKLQFQGHPLQQLYKDHVLPFERIRAELLKQTQIKQQPSQNPASLPGSAANTPKLSPKLPPAVGKPAVSDPRRDPRKRQKAAAANATPTAASSSVSNVDPAGAALISVPSVTSPPVSKVATVLAPQSAAGQLLEQLVCGLLGVLEQPQSLPVSFVGPLKQLVKSCQAQASSDVELHGAADQLSQLHQVLKRKHEAPHQNGHQNGHSKAPAKFPAPATVPAARGAPAKLEVGASGKPIVNAHPDVLIAEPGPAIKASDPRLMQADEAIETVPAFNPTEEEFKDPAAYLESILQQVHDKGMALINPPESWRRARVHEAADPNQYFYSKVQKIAHSQRDQHGDPGFTVDPENRYNLTEWREFADAWKQAKFPECAQNEDPMLMEQHYWSAMKREEKLQTRYCSDVEGRLVEDSPWSATQIAKLEGTALSVIDSDIEGVTSPYLYIGMCGSFFCWHTEDNDLYSINYLHEGSRKTWFGVPPSYQAQMDAQFQTEFPQHHAKFPDMCYRKCFMMHPTSLREAGIPVFRHIQQPGQIAITIPKGYHAGFSHGYTLAESSNFGLKDWVPVGSLAAERYRWGNWETLIEMDELLWDLVERKSGSPVARLAAQELSRRIQREVYERKAATKTIKLVKETTGASEEFQNLQGSRCHVCRHPCYFSMVMRHNPKFPAQVPKLSADDEVAVACPAHCEQLAGEGELTLWLWHSDDTLRQWLSSHNYDVPPLPSLLDYELAKQRSSTATSRQHGKRNVTAFKTNEQKRLLDEWWEQHIDGKDYTRTYITKEEKAALGKLVGLEARKAVGPAQSAQVKWRNR